MISTHTLCLTRPIEVKSNRTIWIQQLLQPALKRREEDSTLTANKASSHIYLPTVLPKVDEKSTTNIMNTTKKENKDKEEIEAARKAWIAKKNELKKDLMKIERDKIEKERSQIAEKEEKKTYSMTAWLKWKERKEAKRKEQQV